MNHRTTTRTAARSPPCNSKPALVVPVSPPLAPRTLRGCGWLGKEEDLQSRSVDLRCSATATKRGQEQLATYKPEPTASLALPSTVRYLFVVPEYRTEFGQSLKVRPLGSGEVRMRCQKGRSHHAPPALGTQVVGSCQELGGWDATKAPSLKWYDGHRWQLDIMLPRMSFEFKVGISEAFFDCDLILSSSLSTTQIIMTHGSFTRWEQGTNRVVQVLMDVREAIDTFLISCPSRRRRQADMDNMKGGSGTPVEIIVRVKCFFNETENTQLALMLPRDKIEGEASSSPTQGRYLSIMITLNAEAFEIGRATLEMLEHRLNKLKQRLQKEGTNDTVRICCLAQFILYIAKCLVPVIAPLQPLSPKDPSHSCHVLLTKVGDPSKQLELNAMFGAVAGHSSSVSQLGQLLEVPQDAQEDMSMTAAAVGDDDFVPVPIGRVPVAPRVESGDGSAGHSSASVSTLAKLAALSFLPPGSVTSELLLAQGRSEDDDDVPSFISAQGYYDSIPRKKAEQKAPPAAALKAASAASAEDRAFERARASAARVAAARAAAVASAQGSAAEVAAGLRRDSCSSEESSEVASIDYDRITKLAKQEEAARLLDSAAERMKRFFEAHRAGTSAGAQATDDVDAAGSEKVKELTALMAEAEVAWERAHELEQQDLPEAEASNIVDFRRTPSAQERAR